MEKKKSFAKNIPMFLTIGGTQITSPIPLHDYADVDTIVNNKVVVFIDYATVFSAVVAVALIVVAGYTFITAAGDPEKIEKGQKGLVAAIVGMVIVFLARTLIVYLVGKIIGN